MGLNSSVQVPCVSILSGQNLPNIIVTAFEVALNGFNTLLEEKGYNQGLKNQKLQWAYEQLTPCDIGNTEAITRLPITFGIIDNARRLRNLIVHNQGLFNERYGKGVLKFRDIKVDMHPHYSLYNTNLHKPTPVIFDTPYFLNFSKAHLEVLHLLHNKIQKKYFSCEMAMIILQKISQSSGIGHYGERRRLRFSLLRTQRTQQ